MIGIRIRAVFPDYVDRLGKFVTLAAQKIRKRMRERLAGPRSGKLYPRTGGRGFARFHQASKRGESPATDTGAYSRSLQVVRKGTLEAAIETNLDYPFILESTKFDRPLARPSVNDMLPELTQDLTRMLN